jgi:hypothetical protein
LSFWEITGGGTSSTPAAPAAPSATVLTIAGVASAGKPITNGTVTLKDVNNVLGSASLGSQGAYSIDVTTMTAPFRLKVVGFSGGTPQELYSVAVAPNMTANINPLSHIALAEAAGLDDPKTAFDSLGIGAITTARVQTAVADLKTNLLGSFQSQGFAGADIDPITGAFTADGTGLDRVFDFIDFKLNITSGSITVKNRKDNMQIASFIRGDVFQGPLKGLSAPGTVKVTRVIDLSSISESDIASLIPTIPLSVAKEVSVVNAKTSTSAAVQSLSIAASKLRRALFAVIQVDTLPPDSDYFEDETHIYVEERSMESFEIVNEILCSIEQSRYDEMVNKGPYTAQIDVSLCESDGDSAGNAAEESQNQSSGSGQPEFELWTQDSVRADNGSTHSIKTWIHQEGDDFEPSSIIRAHTEITEGVSDSNPYGIFTLNFKAHPLNSQGAEDTSTTTFKGFLKSEKNAQGKVVLNFALDGGFNPQGGSVSFTQRAVLDKNPDGEDGSGRLSGSTFGSSGGQSFSEGFDFSVAFDESHFLRVATGQTAGETSCFSRNSFNETAWRYGVYNDTGSRVTRNSGFSIAYDDGSNVHEGWIGFWGFWFPENVNVPDGALVQRRSQEASEATSYTVFKAPGKLIRHSREVLTLGQIINIPLQYHESSGQGQGTEFQVVWNGTNFVKTDQLIQNQNDGQQIWTALTPPTTIVFDPNEFAFGFWSRALGGNGFVQLQREGIVGLEAITAIDNDTQVIFHQEETVYPGDATVPTTLACFDQCPDGSNLMGSSPFHASQNYHPKSTSSLVVGTDYYQYSLDRDSLTLTAGATSITITTSSNEFRFGLRSGPMMDPVDFSEISCQFGPMGAMVNHTCAYKLWNDVDTFYTWETGVNEWNQFSGLKDPSDQSFLRFEEPLRLKYSHQRSDQTTAAFMLDYSGFGDLHGIPGKCINPDTGVDADCGPNSRWIPEFTIPDDSALTAQTSAGSVDYISKLLRKNSA